MKNQSNPRREQAVALIIVLAMLVLLSGLIVSFMTSVRNERAASVANSDGLTSHQLADSTVNLVISQIRQATLQHPGGGTAPTTWASQPGAIRTLSGVVGPSKPITNGAGGVQQFKYIPGTEDYIFKLYSADKMKIRTSELGGKVWDTNETDVIEKWDRTKPDDFKAYVDLNEPVLSPLPPGATGNNPNVVEPRYPIIDPRAKFSPTEALPSPPADPGIVDGFDIKTTGLADATLKFIAKDRKGISGASSPVQYLPMPVKWLYVMRDGTMSAADDISGKISGASSENPIIGRTAFWADDDSCKLNINTASEGTFWDTPTASSERESGNVDGSGGLTSSNTSMSLGASQPARGEFQRYPGHPATTCLSPAIGWLWDILPSKAPLATRDVNLVKMKDAINSMAPFSPYSYHAKAANLPDPVNPAPRQSTSMGASYNPDKDVENDSATGKPKAPLLAVATKHLYATVDEYIYNSSDRGITNAKAPTTLNNANLNPDALEKVRFFLTANSRSPELNLFGRPRVTFWPVSAKEGLRTGYDDLFAFTSTLYKAPGTDRSKDKTFYFTRYDAKSYKNDYKSSVSGKQNVDVMNYLRTMTSSQFPIPGFGGSFEGKYGTEEKNEILTLIFDYCRSVNLVDTSTRNRVGAFQPYTPFYGKLSSTYTGGAAPRSADWSGQVSPIRIDDPENGLGYQGLGRFFTIVEAGMIFYRTGNNRPAMANTQDSIQAVLAFEMATPMPGLPAIRETYYTVVRVVRPTYVTLTAGGGKQDIELVGAPGVARWNICNVPSHDVAQGRGFMPTLGYVSQMCYYSEPAGWTDYTDDARPKADVGSVAKAKIFSQDVSTLVLLDITKYERNKAVAFYPYVSKKIVAPSDKEAKGMKIEGGAYDVEIWSGEAPDDPRAQLVQTIHLNFPGNANPQPPLSPEKSLDTVIPEGAANTDASFARRLSGINQESPTNFIATNGGDDIVRTIELTTGRPTSNGAIFDPQPSFNMKGDMRLAMARRDVPIAFFEPREGLDAYNDGTRKRIFGFQIGHGEMATGNSPGNLTNPAAALPLLVANGKNNAKIPILPAVPKGESPGVQRSDKGPGDWDRGLSKHTDGAFGGKVDEGNVFFNLLDNDQGGRVPYFRGRGIEETGQSFFSPNRQLSSAVMFGSLPTGVVRGLPFQTLLFRPDRGVKSSHPGAQTLDKPADHLLLDLFNLPVVEPYAISEPFSSGGKVNLNYVIAPFGYAKGDSGTRAGNTMPRSYLRRDTAIRGVLKSVKIMAVPTAQENAAHAEQPVPVPNQFRFDIDAEKTLDQFEDRLKDPSRGLFRSASEICDMDLYPVITTEGPKKPSDWGAFWETDYAQTGDNMRERPYSHIYPRVTTKSNTYTVHMRCQAIKKTAETPADEFTKRDKVVGEYRGSATIERFIDPNDKYLESYDATDAAASVDQFYRFRVVSTKQFLPR